ncbi:AraC family transcriptional regulator [Pleurocapsa sp. CCALA 161]|uniref:helix-turn-helix transcriptional regulator n=1 Tax=Pleurocapsa sp. CCALA 161 TaxID=2107688 RepID=UPI000D0596A8|nr:helix-turn-helix transcriptional regulator [Pleurocapsa sp. CCALA 161]PSB09523.1 AraC family transcriptional regulator [Pleurocapsa sp. CCALA 161]
MVTRLMLERYEDWLERGSYKDSRLLHSDKSDRIQVCPSHLGQGYRQEIPLRDDLSLVIENYRLDRNLVIDIPSHNSFVAFGFPLTGADARHSLFDVCFGLREIHIKQSQQQIFNVEIVFKQSTTAIYLQEFMARLFPQTLDIAEQVIRSIYRYRKGYSSSNTKEMLERVLQDTISVDSHSSQATLEQVLSGTVYPEIQDIEYARHNLISATMERVIGQILSCPYQGTTRRAYLKQKALNLVTLYFEEGMLRSRLNKSDLNYIYQAEKILKSQSINPPTTEMLAKQVGTNRFKLNQGFHQVHNTTPFGYLRNYRLRKAKRLLMTSELSVEEVAAAVGYKSRSNFAIAFRQQFGVNPKVLQMQVRQEVS